METGNWRFPGRAFYLYKQKLWVNDLTVSDRITRLVSRLLPVQRARQKKKKNIGFLFCFFSGAQETALRHIVDGGLDTSVSQLHVSGRSTPLSRRRRRHSASRSFYFSVRKERKKKIDIKTTEHRPQPHYS